MNVPVEILRCIDTGQSLRTASESLIRSLKDAQSAGTLRNRDGEVPASFEDGLVTPDGAWFYPIRTGIPVLLASEVIAVPGAKSAAD